jgi:ribosomal protein L44E
MTQHYPRSTVSADGWCPKCQRFTQHRIDDRRRGPCLDCIARLNLENAQHEIDRRREARQGSLFGEKSA